VELNPQQSLDRLRSRRLAYERARGDRTEQTQALQASITHAEIEISNLSRKVEHDPQLKDLYRQLVFETEMGRGTLKQQTTMVR
jgi:hypothetical protein